MQRTHRGRGLTSVVAAIALVGLSAWPAVAVPPAGGGGASGEGSTDVTVTATYARPGAKRVTAAAVPAGCTLSPYHSVFDEEAPASNKVTLGWSASASLPVDPGDANYHLRTAAQSVTNNTHHTLYSTTTFVGWMFFFRTNTNAQGYNYAAWDQANNRFQTDASTDVWPATWQPRDATVSGGVMRLFAGSYPVSVVSPTTLGFTQFGSETRPGYVITDDVAPGATSSWSQVMQVERPTNNGGYGWSQYRYVSAKTCLPVPVIAAIPSPGVSTLSGTGTTAGDTLVITDQAGHTLGTAIVGADLTWTLTLSTPLAASVTTVHVAETDEFGYVGNTQTTVPSATVSPTPSPTPSSSASATTAAANASLADTGSATSPAKIVAAAALVVVGSAILLIARRRRPHSH